MLADGGGLVLAVWGWAWFGKPDRREWNLARYDRDEALGDSAAR